MQEIWSAWAQAVTHPLGLAGFALFLVFLLGARSSRSQQRWISPTLAVLATLSLVGSLFIAHQSGPAGTQAGPPAVSAAPPGSHGLSSVGSGPEPRAPGGVEIEVAAPMQAGRDAIVAGQVSVDNRRYLDVKVNRQGVSGEDLERTNDALREIAQRADRNTESFETLRSQVDDLLARYDLLRELAEEQTPPIPEEMVFPPDLEDAFRSDDVESAHRIIGEISAPDGLVGREFIRRAQPEARTLVEVGLTELGTGSVLEARALFEAVGLLPSASQEPPGTPELLSTDPSSLPPPGRPQLVP